MLRFFVLLNLILCPLVISKHAGTADDLGAGLITSLRNDANLDLPADAEYEDLRAELLAYHTALASITSTRRSMKTTPCWKLGGICIDHKMCIGHKYLTEVRGCKNNLEVCCFTWNNFQVRDFRDKGINVGAMPWAGHKEFGGKGVVDLNDPHDKKHRKKHKKQPHYDDEEYFEPKPAHLTDSSQHKKTPQQKWVENERLIFEQANHEQSDHEQSDHKKPHHENSYFKRSLDDKAIVIILNTDEK